MLKKLCVIACAIFFFACSKNGSSPNNNTTPPTPKPSPVITSFSPVSGAVDTIVTITGAHFNPDISKDIVKFNGTTAVTKSGTESQLVVTVPSGASSGKISVSVDTSIAVSAQDFTVQSGNKWTLITSFPGTFMQNMTSFKIGNKLYIGIGQSYTGNLQEFWQYDILSGVWTQKSSFPAMPLPGQGVGFSVGNKGYVIMSPDSLSYPAIWEYDTASDKWTAKGYFPQNLQQGMIAFNIDNYAYVGPGGDGYSGSRKVWQYDPAANKWTPKSDFPGAGTTWPAAFTIGHYAYVGTGMTGMNTVTGSKDFYRYDPSSDTWMRKADFPGAGRNSAAGFAIGTFGYLGTGMSTTGYVPDFWQYNPSADAWIQIKDFGGSYRGSASAFSGNLQGYVGFGMGSAHQAGPGGGYNSIYIDLWQYQP
ncbi:MAG: IPT/TIG domain-containing protein [Bacteroidota bacterium]|nr:IPT/TIG domain-containing protein [Bacteroidota bacterium]